MCVCVHVCFLCVTALCVCVSVCNSSVCGQADTGAPVQCQPHGVCSRRVSDVLLTSCSFWWSFCRRGGGGGGINLP